MSPAAEPNGMPYDRDIQSLLEQAALSEIDIHFARLMTRLSGQDTPDLFLAAALVSHAKSEGNVCLDLSAWAGKPFPRDDAKIDSFDCPPLSQWLDTIRAGSVVGKPGDYKPLILDARARLYLYRYWEYEDILAKKLHARAMGENSQVDVPLLKDGLARLFPQTGEKTVNRQKLAALVSVLKPFCVISGGPGTGKSTLIATIMVLILEQNKGKTARISLAAPTGKAAARLQETLRKGKETLNTDTRIKAAIPTEASTIHRLLGTKIGSPYFRHHAENPLPADLVVIDEASMVDLALMSKLLQAIPSEAGLILIGDRDQLASVEAGAVLGDICDTGRTHGFSGDFFNKLVKITGDRVDISPDTVAKPGIRDCLVALNKNFRFQHNSGISAVSRAVRQGNADHALTLLRHGSFADIKWVTLPEKDALSPMLHETVVQGYRPFLTTEAPMEALRLFEQFRLLCALRQGPYGVSGLNVLVERLLGDANLIHPTRRWYRGRPVMITRNDYRLGLFNGDIGIVLPDPNTGMDLRAFFLSPEGRLRKFLPMRLPEHETAYAMTVHKSQGSEFDKVLILLPDRPSRLLTRELIYTGITRAKENVEVWGRNDVFLEGVKQRIERSSGLRDALWA